MKKSFILILLFSISIVSFSQKTYTSSVTTKYKTEGEVIEKSRTITISDTKISISDYLGGTRTLVLTVDNIVEKEFGWDGLCKWYYCTSTEKDVINDELRVEAYLLYKKVNKNKKIDSKRIPTNTGGAGSLIFKRGKN